MEIMKVNKRNATELNALVDLIPEHELSARRLVSYLMDKPQSDCMKVTGACSIANIAKVSQVANQYLDLTKYQVLGHKAQRHHNWSLFRV